MNQKSGTWISTQRCERLESTQRPEKTGKKNVQWGKIVNSFARGNKASSSTLWLCSEPGIVVQLSQDFFSLN